MRRLPKLWNKPTPSVWTATAVRTLAKTPAAIAEIRMICSRQEGTYPNGLPILAVECKDKRGYGELDEMRQKLAQMYDLVLVTRPAAGWSCRIFETAANTHWGRRSSKYTAAIRSGTFGIARLGTFRKGAKMLAGHYSIEQYENVLSASASI